ncbi:hypothetical protein PAF17_16515 [Paracoccus sp. Z330]|uniref:Adenylosuccinate lyase C-terminal domain-containing protein n=1 Tax=Paracoccus onchidii TaxID=3017813 RepID=A0ABT4ZIA8_9RHOB|nr:hypothetical protein [Paracoccus onchidii]MDB6179096.1 hypothetical protein [Paracoccus onchidii]
MAEAVMMAMAPKMGRPLAHEVVVDACRTALERKLSLADILSQNEQIVATLGSEEKLRQHCGPEAYLGLSGPMADRAIAAVVRDPDAHTASP